MIINMLTLISFDENLVLQIMHLLLLIYIQLTQHFEKYFYYILYIISTNTQNYNEQYEYYLKGVYRLSLDLKLNFRLKVVH